MKQNNNDKKKYFDQYFNKLYMFTNNNVYE